MSIISVKLDKESAEQIASALRGMIDDEFMLYAHHRLAAYLDPYIPKETGTLAQSNIATSENLEYFQPYAHYQYTGLVWGPNFPIKENGIIVGWYSPPKKSPTGRMLTYSHEVNPLAGPNWDTRMMADRGAQFAGDLERFAANRFNGGG